jgi:formate dehydrogenase subunit gamma
MSEVGVPGASHVPGPSIMREAMNNEDAVVGDEIVRHKLSARLIHWAVAVTFLGALMTGLPVWSPVFGWMAYFFGGLQVCRWLHAWIGVAFALSSVAMFIQWIGQMRFDRYDRKFNLRYYVSHDGEEDQDVGRYNGGQKFYFFAAGVGALALLISGIILWWPMTFSIPLRWFAIILHDISFIAFFAAMVGHVYLSTAAEPGTFQSMTRGTVTKAWARTHHPRWYREVTGATETSRPDPIRADTMGRDTTGRDKGKRS